MHYKGTGQMHSFRGLLANGTQDKIRIQGATGEIAWRITKFELMTNVPADAGSDTEHVVMIWRSKRTTTELGDTTTTQPDFRVSDLLGAGVNIQDVAGSGHGYWVETIFDNDLFNRNIYISHRDVGGSAIACNYYLELEEVKVSAAGMAQLSVAAARRRYVPGT